MDQRERLARGVEHNAAIKVGDWAKASRLMRQATPLYDQMGVTIVELDEGKAILTMELSDSVRGLMDGSIHGGILATFADIAMAFSLGASFDENEARVTSDMHIRFYRQPHSGPLRAEATVVHRGRRLLSTECSVTDAEQRVLIRSTATYMLIPRGA